MEKIQHKTVKTNGINMHIATTGPPPPTAPTILFIHGFPELWYTWRHQLLSLSSLGYHCIAPDLRGYGDTDAPSSTTEYTVLHVVGDLVGLIDHLGIEKLLLVGHDWGAIICWYFCLLRPERVSALVNMSVAFFPRDPQVKPVDKYRRLFGDDYYICRFQVPGEAEEDFAKADTAKVIRKFLTSRNPKPPCIPKEIGFRGLRDPPDHLPSWLSEADINYYATKFNQKGFSGALNYYRCIDLNWELMAPWTAVQIKVPVKFIVGDLDATYNIPGVKEYINNGGLKRCVPFLQEVVVMKDTAHFINQEKAEEVNSHIYEFFSKFEPAAAARI